MNLILSTNQLRNLYQALHILQSSGTIERTSRLYRSIASEVSEQKLSLGLRYKSTVDLSSLEQRINGSATLKTCPDFLQMDTRNAVPVLATERRVLELTKTSVFGILNVTSDSFSDGGKYLNPDLAYRHAVLLSQEGADVIDIGAESTRPQATPISAELELQRLLPVLRLIRSDSALEKTLISVDTSKAEVASAALAAGADIVNDVSGINAAAAAKEVPYVLMHSRGTPDTMQRHSEYPRGVVSHVIDELKEKLSAAKLWDFNVILDSGIGFAKTTEQNWQLIRELPLLKKQLSYSWLLGHSNKQFLREACQEPELGNLAILGAAASANVEFVRVHSVKKAVQYLKMADRCYRASVSS